MELNPPRVAIVGCGRVGQKRFRALPAGIVTVACDLDPSRAQKLASLSENCRATDSVSEVVRSPNVDVVVVATVNASLASIACEALRANKHVLVEKPGAVSVKQLDEMARLAAEHRVQVRVGYNHRYHPAFRKARELVESGSLGPILFVRGRYGHGGRPGYEREWRADPKLSGGGELLDQGVHLIDLASLFLGQFTSVEGHVTTCFWNMPVEDNAFLSLRNARGQTAWLHASWTEWKNLFSLEICCRGGKLHMEGLGGSYGVERLHRYLMLPQMGPPEVTTFEYPDADESWRTEMMEFFEDIRVNRPSVPGLQEARAVLSVVEQIYARKP